MLRKISISWLIFLIFAGMASCDKNEKAKVISLEKREEASLEVNLSSEKPIRFAVGAKITPKQSFAYYKNLFNYIEKKLGRPLDYVNKENYGEINVLLKTGNIDAAFVGSGPYVTGHDEFNLELLVIPQTYGKTVYYSYIIVPIDSSVKNLKELRGKSFAFTDPLSHSGKMVPTYMLGKMEETPDSFFNKYVFTYAHEKSIEAVASKLVDGAAMDSFIWEYGNKTNPEFTSKTKIIEKSPPYGIPPVVVRPGLDPDLKKKLKEIFLSIHKDEEGREILKSMMVDKFVLGDDAAYNSIREMNAWMKQHQKAK